jgi:DNA-directed RNA polymerase specialized sigma24 family protein
MTIVDGERRLERPEGIAAGPESPTASSQRRRARRRPKPEDLANREILASLERLARKMLRTLPVLRCHEPEDLVQAALQLAIERLAQFEGRSSLKTWVCSIARRKFIDLSRRAKIRPVPAGEAVEGKEARVPSSSPELRRDTLELVSWLKDKGRAEVPGGAEVLVLLINSGASWDYTSGAMSTLTGKPWTVEAVKGAVRRIKRTDRGRALCEVIGTVEEEESA